MKIPEPMSSEILDLLRTVDTSRISNAIETLNVRMRNEGYIQTSLSCLMPSLAPVAGYAVTGRIRTGAPPISNLCYYQRTDWWEYMAQFPSHKIMVLADVDPSPGAAAFVGEIHAGSAGLWVAWATSQTGRFAMCPLSSATGSSVSPPAFALLTPTATSWIGRAGRNRMSENHSGDVLQGDRHGVQSIPRGIDARLADAVQTIRTHEADLIELCRSADFSVEKLTTMLLKDVSCPLRNHI
jgi:4-hydroxy-4-methyl-2-oxoglutarate aldolase